MQDIISSSLWNNLQKDWLKVQALIQSTNLIIEVVDARIVRSTSDLFNYENNHDLMAVPRIVYFTYEDRADPKITKLWRSNYRKKNIYVVATNFFKNHVLVDLLSVLTKAKIIHYQPISADIFKIAVVGVPKVGKKQFINSLNDGESSLIINEKLWSKITKKNVQYQLTPNIEVTDTIAIFAPDLKTSQNKVINLQIFKKLDLANLTVPMLATNAFLQILVTNHQALNNAYGLNISSQQAHKEISPEQIGNFFKTIAANLDLVNEYNSIDVEAAFGCFLTELYTGKISLLSLETP